MNNCKLFDNMLPSKTDIENMSILVYKILKLQKQCRFKELQLLSKLNDVALCITLANLLQKRSIYCKMDFCGMLYSISPIDR